MTRESPTMAELLDQDKVWYSRHGRELTCQKLDEMDLDHIKSLRAWLLRNAESIHYDILNDLEIATIMRLVKLALSSPPGTHTETQLRAIETVRRKLEGTGEEVDGT